MSDFHDIWWKTGTCYQIWPRSFKDSNGDGIGDIPGIISSLDYLKALGIDMIWLSPMYASPQRDMGYDIADYEDVAPEYGTLGDMDTLIQEVHVRGMKILLDLVINHTSDRHHWFQESKKSRDNEFSNFYIWRDPKYTVDGQRQPPNNWASAFGGSAWEYVQERNQYYLHIYTIGQPDLNWDNKVTRNAIYESAIRFWLRRGVDGFRVDTVNLYCKDLSFPDAPIRDPSQEYQFANEYILHGPYIHEWLKELRREALDEFGEVILVGELGSTNIQEFLKYISPDSRELNMAFEFSICELGGRVEVPPHLTWQHSLPDLKAAFRKSQSILTHHNCWPTVFAENHDQPRSVSALTTDDPTYCKRAAKMLAILLATQSGTLFIYQGQEIGMTNMPVSWGSRALQDCYPIWYLEDIQKKHPDDPDIQQRALSGVLRNCRENARLPVQWSPELNAGFTTGTPWMPIHENYKAVNVQTSLQEPDGVLATWKRMLTLRKKHIDVLIRGKLEIHDFDNPNVFTYSKTYLESEILVVLNFSSSTQVMVIPSRLRNASLTLQITNVENSGNSDGLSPWEGRVYLVGVGS